MKKKFLTYLMSVCFLISFSLICTACSCSIKDPPSKNLEDITIESDLIQNGRVTVVYQPSFADYFSLSDFKVYANFSDDTIQDVTQYITMKTQGPFTVAEGGQLVFSYNDESISVQVTVTPRNINGSEFVVGNLAESYVLPAANESVRPEVTLAWGQTTLVKNTDFTLSYGANDYTAIGENGGYVLLTGTGNYMGSISKTFDIEPIGSVQDIEFNPTAQFEYDGETHNFAIPENVYANHESVLSVNYAYSTDDGTTWTSTTGDIPANVGSYKVKAVFVMKAGYAQLPDKVKNVSVVPTSIANAYKSDVVTSATFSGQPIEVTTELANLKLNQDSQDLLTFGTDFVVDTTYNENGFVNGYKNNVNIGTAEVRVKGVGNYNGSRTLSFIIEQKEVLANQINILGLKTNYIFTGSNITEPNLKVFVEGDELRVGTDYDVTYYNNKYASTSLPVVKVTLKGNYIGNTQKDFDILPYSLDVSSLQFSADAGSNALIYNTSNQFVEYTQSSLSAWLTSLAQADAANGTNYAGLIYTPQNTTGVLTIGYEYLTKTQYDSYPAVPHNVADNYYVRATFKSVDGVAEANEILNSIKIMKGGYVVNSKQIEHNFAIKPFHVTKQNSVLQYVENYGVEAPHFTYGTNGGILEPAARLLVDINADGENEEYTDVYDYTGVKNEIGIVYERTYETNSRIYPASNYAYKVMVNGGNNFIVDEDVYLAYYVDSCVITADNFNEYFENPTVTRIKGNEKTQALYVSDAVTTSKVVSFDERDKYVFYIKSLESTESISKLKCASVTMKMSSSTGYNSNYVMNGTVDLTVVELNPVTMGIYTEIKINKTENNYATAQDVTNTFFKDYDTLPYGTYVYFKTAEDVEITKDVHSETLSMVGDKLVKGDYVVEELFGFTKTIEAPNGADYRVYQLDYHDKPSAHFYFNSAYEPLNGQTVTTFTTYSVYASFPELVTPTGLVVQVNDGKTTLDSCEHAESGMVKENYYRAVISKNLDVPENIYVEYTLPTEYTSWGYRYGLNDSVTYKACNNGAITTISEDFVYGAKLWIYVNDILAFTIEFDFEYETEEIYALSHASNWSGEVFYMTKVEKANVTNFAVGNEFEVNVNESLYGEIIDICADINTVAGADGYDVVSNSGVGFTEIVDMEIYIIKFWKDGDPKTIIAEYQISIEN